MHGRKPLFLVVQAKQLESIEISLTDEEQPKCIDWRHDVTDWEELCEQNAEVLVLFERFDDEGVRAAQKQELISGNLMMFIKKFLALVNVRSLFVG